MNFLDADYSAIEARITCWLAGQEDALQEYRDGVDRYVKMASVIYRVPEEKVNKHPQRFVGKHAVLGCGFGMGPPKFRVTVKKQGGYELPAGLEDTAVHVWRQKHKKVVSFWYDMERAAKSAILHEGKVFAVRERIKFQVRDIEGMPFLLMRLPSGRKLAYPKPRLCGDRIAFFGNVKGVVWGDISTWGGSLVENCLSGETEVLSQHRGWVELRSITTADRLWDGAEFVTHEGLIYKGIQKVQDFHGLWVTPDHRFLTVENSWVSVQTACTNPLIQLYSPHEPKALPPKSLAAAQHCRSQIWQHDCVEDAPNHREKDGLALQMRLWKRSSESGIRVTSEETSYFWMWHEMPIHKSSSIKAKNSRHEQTSCSPLLGSYESEMLQPQAQSVAQLRRTGNFSLQTVEKFFRELLGGYGTNVSRGTGHRPEGQQWELHPRKLLVDNTQEEHSEQTHDTSIAGISDRFLGHSFSPRNQAQHAVLPDQSGSELGADHQHAARFSEQVYDIKNCGPRHRFAVRGRSQRILIAHNCVQAIAADIMAHGSHNAERAGYPIATLIHDQALAYQTNGQTAERFVELLTDLPAWAAGLPIAAEGSEVPFYRKD